MVHQAFSGHDLTPDDLSAVRGTLGQAGVELWLTLRRRVGSVRRSDGGRGIGSPQTQGDSVQNGGQRTGERTIAPARCGDRPFETNGGGRPRDATNPLQLWFRRSRTHNPGREALAHPSDESFERLVSDSEVRSRIQYLPILPNLIKETQVLDRKAAAAYRKWRQALGQA